MNFARRERPVSQCDADAFAEGRVCADGIVPYPPGIPVLVPGQLITENIVEYLIRYLRVQNKVELHGVVYQGYFPSVRVLTAAEQARLSSLRA